jgi:hypothetical protein
MYDDMDIVPRQTTVLERDETGQMYQTRCPVDGCKSTDLWLMECAPGYTWAYVNQPCGHWGFLQRRQENN